MRYFFKYTETIEYVFLGIMQTLNFPGIIAIRTRTYMEIFKSAFGSVHLRVFFFINDNGFLEKETNYITKNNTIEFSYTIHKYNHRTITVHTF